MIIEIQDADFRGKGNKQKARYFKYEIEALLAQTDAVAIERVNVEVKTPRLRRASMPIDTSIATPVTAFIALDSQGNQLKAPHHKLALPCPPYCGKNGGDTKLRTIGYRTAKRMFPVS